MGSGLPPGDRALQLVALYSEVNAVGHELEVLTESVAVRSGDNALDLPVVGIDVDYSTGEREGAGALPLDRRFAHKAREIGPAVHECGVAGGDEVRPGDLYAAR